MRQQAHSLAAPKGQAPLSCWGIGFPSCPKGAGSQPLERGNSPKGMNLNTSITLIPLPSSHYSIINITALYLYLSK